MHRPNAVGVAYVPPGRRNKPANTADPATCESKDVRAYVPPFRRSTAGSADEKNALTHNSLSESICESSERSAAPSRSLFVLDSSKESDTSHILEVYDFPSDCTTLQLQQLLIPVSKSLKSVQFVKKGSALAIFESPQHARYALSTVKHPYFKMRPFSESSKEAMETVACVPVPAAQRPASDSSSAKRLICGALNIRQPPRQIKSRAELDAERERERHDRERRRQGLPSIPADSTKKNPVKDAWDD